MNIETMTPVPTFVKWISMNAIQRGVSHSSIRIGFADADQAKRAVEQKIFFGRYNKRTKYGRKVKPRCMNCLQDGHTSNHCKSDMMCPYCAGNHAAEKCELKGKTLSNCTACAREIKKKHQDMDLSVLFSTTPAHLHHSPLNPTCPTRLELKKQEAAKAATSSVHRQATNPPGNVQTNDVTTLTGPAKQQTTTAATGAGGNDDHMVISL